MRPCLLTQNFIVKYLVMVSILVAIFIIYLLMFGESHVSIAVMPIIALDV